MDLGEDKLSPEGVTLDNIKCGMLGCKISCPLTATPASIAHHYRLHHESLNPKLTGHVPPSLNDPEAYANCDANVVWSLETKRSLGKHQNKCKCTHKGKHRILGPHPECTCAGCAHVWDKGGNRECPCSHDCRGTTQGIAPRAKATNLALDSLLQELEFLDDLPDEVVLTWKLPTRVPGKIADKWYDTWLQYLELLDYCRENPRLGDAPRRRAVIEVMIFQVLTLYVLPGALRSYVLEKARYTDSRLINLAESGDFSMLYAVVRDHEERYIIENEEQLKNEQPPESQILMSIFGAFVAVWHALLVREKFAVLFKLSKVGKSCQLMKRRSSNLKAFSTRR